MILTIVANPEKLQLRLMRFFSTISRRLAMRVIHITDFDGIGAFAVKVPKGEVLLYLLEQQLYLPAFPVDCHNILGAHLHVVCEEGYELGPSFLLVDVGDYACMVLYIVAIFDLLRECHMAFPKCHQPTFCHVYRISRNLIDKILLHLGDIYDTCPAQLLELGVSM